MADITRPPDTGETLPFTHRLVLLVLHYVCGPIIGMNQRLMVRDIEFTEPEKFITWIFLSAAVSALLSPVPNLLRLSLIFILTPILIYSLAPIRYIIMEYRVYLSVLGIAIVTAYFDRSLIAELITGTVAGWFIYCTIKRTRLLSNSELFWKQAYRDCPDANSTVNLMYQLNLSNQGPEAQQLAGRYKDDRAVLINLAMAHLCPAAGGIEEFSADQLYSARLILEDVVARWPDSADGWRNYATVLYYQEHRRDSIKAYLRCTALNPMDGLAWLGLGTAALETAQNEFAVSALRRAFEIYPHIDDIRHKFMESLYKTKRMQEFEYHQGLMSDDNMVFVTREMLPPELQEKYDKIVALEELQRKGNQ